MPSCSVVDRLDHAEPGAPAGRRQPGRSPGDGRATGRLTQREREILQLLAQGLSQVAAKLVISPQTVQTRIRNVLSKLRVHSKLEAAALAAKAGTIAV